MKGRITMFCHFCHRPSGEREFCDEVCYDEYEHDFKEFQDGIKDEYPVGEPRYQEDHFEYRDMFPDTQGGFYNPPSLRVVPLEV
jgi:hypothetical protein